MAPLLSANDQVEQLAANNLTIPQDAIASLLQRLVRLLSRLLAREPLNPDTAAALFRILECD
jgi:hypothetical protein